MVGLLDCLFPEDDILKELSLLLILCKNRTQHQESLNNHIFNIIGVLLPLLLIGHPCLRRTYKVEA